jgi:membrane protease YdiL (CAAX protease family)
MNFLTNRNKLPECPWTITDILQCIGFLFIAFIIIFFISIQITDSEIIEKNIFRYAGTLIFGYAPVFLIKKKHQASIRSLGFQNPTELSFLQLMAMGICVGLLCELLIFVLPFWPTPPLGRLKISDSYWNIILAPISLSGFVSIVLSPISEEIFNRGFLYGYIRKRLTIPLALSMQALFFSLGHLNVFHPSLVGFFIVFFQGLVLGLLYEFTGSLYASISCHAAMNYSNIVFRFSA